MVTHHELAQKMSNQGKTSSGIMRNKLKHSIKENSIYIGFVNFLIFIVSWFDVSVNFE